MACLQLNTIGELLMFREKNISIWVKDNAGHMLSTLNSTAVKDKLERLNFEYKLAISCKEISSESAFGPYLLGTWVKNKEYTSKRKRQRVIGIRAKRCLYNSYY